MGTKSSEYRFSENRYKVLRTSAMTQAADFHLERLDSDFNEIKYPANRQLLVFQLIGNIELSAIIISFKDYYVENCKPVDAIIAARVS